MIVTFYWEDGVVKADTTLSSKIEGYGDTLELTNCDPRAAADRLVGRNLDDVFDLPFPCDARISHADELNGGCMRVVVEPTRHLVNCAEGRILAPQA